MRPTTTFWNPRLTLFNYHYHFYYHYYHYYYYYYSTGAGWTSGAEWPTSWVKLPHIYRARLKYLFSLILNFFKSNFESLFNFLKLIDGQNFYTTTTRSTLRQLAAHPIYYNTKRAGSFTDNLSSVKL